MGYHRAGFDVTGVDINPMPRYPFTFVQADALAYVAEHGHEFDAIAASPPCQAYSEATPLWARELSPDLIAATRDALVETGKPFVIENVENARKHLRNPVMLCGTMFGLEIWRHRWFEVSPMWFLSPSPCRHEGRPVSLHPGSNARKGRGDVSVHQARQVMQIDWMSKSEIHEAIPPAYTEFIGKQLIEGVKAMQLQPGDGTIRSASDERFKMFGPIRKWSARDCFEHTRELFPTHELHARAETINQLLGHGLDLTNVVVDERVNRNQTWVLLKAGDR